MVGRLTVLCVAGDDPAVACLAVQGVLAAASRDVDVVVLASRKPPAGLAIFKDPRVRCRTIAASGFDEGFAACIAELDADVFALIGPQDVFRPSGLELARGALAESGADFCLFNVAFQIDGEPAPAEAVVRSGYLEDVAGLTRAQHLHRLIDPAARPYAGAMLVRAPLLRACCLPLGLSREGAAVDRFLRILLGGRGVFIQEYGLEAPLPPPSSARSRAERFASLRLFQTPGALAQAHQIFSEAALNRALPESMRLWFVGQQLLKRPERETQTLGLECLRDALVGDGAIIAEQLASSMGVAPSTYIDRVSDRVYAADHEGAPPQSLAETRLLSMLAPVAAPSGDAPVAPSRPSATERASAGLAPGKRPTVAVVFTCYSGELYFEAALQSVLAQSYQGIQLVFHDNGCSGSYRDLIERSARQHGGLVVRSEVNRYGEGLRYDVLPFLDTDYVAILHDDDLYTPDKIKRSLEELVASNVDYIFTDRLYVDATGVPFPVDMEEVNNTPLLPEHYPNQLIADTYYIGLRLHFSTLVMRTDLAKKNLLGDPFLPRITDSLFMQRLLLDASVRGMVISDKLTLVRVHGANDMLYTKFDAEARAREFALLNIGEYICFQELVRNAPTEQLGDILAIFPGIPRIAGEDRVGMLVRAALDLRNWFGSKPLMAAYCIHTAFLIDGRATMERVREHSPRIGGGPATDCNGLTQTLYRKYVQTLSDQLFAPREAILREAWRHESDQRLQEAAHAAEQEGARVVASGRQEIEGLRAMNDDQRSEAAKQRAEMEEAHARAIQALESRLAESAMREAQAARRHRQELEQAQARVGEAVAETLNAVRQSRSWRLTQPIRWIGAMSGSGRRTAKGG